MTGTFRISSESSGLSSEDMLLSREPAEEDAEDENEDGREPVPYADMSKHRICSASVPEHDLLKDGCGVCGFDAIFI